METSILYFYRNLSAWTSYPIYFYMGIDDEIMFYNVTRKPVKFDNPN